MEQPKKARKRLAIFIFSALLALSFAAAGVMMLQNSRLTPIDVSDCAEAPKELVFFVDRFDAGLTVYARGGAMLPGSAGVTMSTTALLRDPVSGVFYCIPTATYALDERQAGAMGISDTEAAFAGFFARGLRLGTASSGRELWLLFEDGVVRYLLPTDRSF